MVMLVVRCKGQGADTRAGPVKLTDLSMTLMRAGPADGSNVFRP